MNEEQLFEKFVDFLMNLPEDLELSNILNVIEDSLGQIPPTENISTVRELLDYWDVV